MESVTGVVGAVGLPMIVSIFGIIVFGGILIGAIAMMTVTVTVAFVLVKMTNPVERRVIPKTVADPDLAAVERDAMKLVGDAAYEDSTDNEEYF
jgi:hypothetical protein